VLEHKPVSPVTSSERFRRRIKQRAVIAENGSAVLARDPLGGPTVLAAQELALLTMMADGLRRAEIAEALGISVRSLSDVRRSLLAKLGARTDQHAAALGFRRGLLHAERRSVISSSGDGAAKFR
jgi:DNA-binding CsgD family transcriptional regulator